MASMTASGFCELDVLSRYTSGFPCTWRDRMGKSLRISSALRISGCCTVVICYLISLIFRQLDFFFFGGGVERDGVFVYAFDFPAFLGVDPGVGRAFVGSAHAAHDAAAQAQAQVFQRDALQYRLEEALHDNTLGLFARDAAHHEVEKLLFVDFAGGCAVAGADLVGPDFQAWNRFRAALVAQQQGVIREERG